MSKTREPAKPSTPNSPRSHMSARQSVELPNRLKTNLRAGRQTVRQSPARKPSN